MTTLRKILIGAVSASAIAAFATGAAAQAQSATASVDAKIIQAITIAKTADMNFGTIVRPAVSATVTLSTAGAVTGVTTVGSGQTAAKFHVAGEGGQVITVAESAVNLSKSGETDIPVTLTRAKGAAYSGGALSAGLGGTGTLNGSLGATGDLELVYGATFPVVAATATGAWAGSLQVTVNYQ